MEATAYKLGHLDAVLAYGLAKHGGMLPALAVAAPAAAMAAAADEEHRPAAAGLGALTGLAAYSALRSKKGSLDAFKLSLDLSAGVGIPFLPGVSLGIKDQRERLPGMDRWVPRSSMERGFQYADSGFDPEAVADLEAKRGVIEHPVMGGLAGAGLMAKFAPKSGVIGPVLAGLAGMGLGTVYNHATRDERVREGLEAFSGAQREREKFPIRRHAVQTANESTPLAVSRGHGDA